MANTSKIVSLVIAITIGAVFFAPVADVVSQGSGTQTITNETVTESVEYNTDYDLQGYNIASGSETVERYNSSSGSWEILTGGTDYTITYDAGEIEILNTAATTAGDEIRVSYDYEATDGTTAAIVDVIPLLMALLLLVPLANRVKDGL